MKKTIKEAREDARKAGYDFSKNGGNAENCNIYIFTLPVTTKAWFEGIKDAQDEGM